MNNPHFLGVDLGGTQMRMAAVNMNGELVTPMFAVLTGKQFTPQNFHDNLQTLHAQVLEVIASHPIAALGIGITGLVSATSISQADFIPLLNGVNIVELVQQAIGLPTKIENDARCFVLAETRFGAARGARHVVGVTLGTGAGGGVIIDGKLHRGANGNAGEIWSIPLRDQWLEYFVSNTGLVHGYQKAGGEVANVDAAKIAELARNGDAAAITAFQSYGADLAVLCETIRALLDPEVVVIGGSIAQAHDVFGEDLLQRVAEKGPRIAWAKLGTAAGVIGAASLHL